MGKSNDIPKPVRRGKHIRDCGSVAMVKAEQWDSCWVPDFDSYPFFADGLARRGGHKVWLTFRCNDPTCPALMLVPSALIEAHIPKT